MHLRSKRHPCVLLSFYNHHRDALESCKRLRQLHIGRSATIHKSREGRVEVENTTTWHGMLWGAVLGLLGGILVGLAALGYEGLSAGAFGPVIFVLATFIGAIFGVIVFHILGLGIGKQLVKKFSSRLVAGETVVLVQASPLLVGRAINTLRQEVETDPAVFAFHTRHVRFVPTSGGNREPSSSITSNRTRATFSRSRCFRGNGLRRRGAPFATIRPGGTSHWRGPT